MLAIATFSFWVKTYCWRWVQLPALFKAWSSEFMVKCSDELTCAIVDDRRSRRDMMAWNWEFSNVDWCLGGIGDADCNGRATHSSGYSALHNPWKASVAKLMTDRPTRAWVWCVSLEDIVDFRDFIGEERKWRVRTELVFL